MGIIGGILPHIMCRLSKAESRLPRISGE